MDRISLKNSLEKYEGFKKLIKPYLFFFGGPKKSWDVYQKASEKEVFDNYILAEYSYEDYNYYVCAFSENNVIEQNILTELKNSASNLDLGLVRLESIDFSGLQHLKGKNGSFQSENQVISNSLSKAAQGIHVYVIANDKKVSFPLVIYAKLDNEIFIYPVKK